MDSSRYNWIFLVNSLVEFWAGFFCFFFPFLLFPGVKDEVSDLAVKLWSTAVMAIGIASYLVWRSPKEETESKKIVAILSLFYHIVVTLETIRRIALGLQVDGPNIANDDESFKRLNTANAFVGILVHVTETIFFLLWWQSANRISSPTTRNLSVPSKRKDS